MENHEKNQFDDRLDCQASEKLIEQANIGTVYDSVSEFKQGIAIVTQKGMYGAIMVGNKVLVKPIYKELTGFQNGYAKAKFPITIDGDPENIERLITMSGQIIVKQGDKDVFLPDIFDWGSNFIGNICIVVKNRFYGVINNRFEVIHECVYSSFVNFINGYATLSNDSESVIIDKDAKICYKIIERFSDNICIVTGNDNLGRQGVINSKMELIIPIIYQDFQRLDCGCFVTESSEGTKLFIDSTTGNIINELPVDSVVNINMRFFVTHKDNETCLFKSPNSLLLRIPFKVIIYEAKSNEYETNSYEYVANSYEDEDNSYEVKSNSTEVEFRLNGLEYLCDTGGNLYIIAKLVYFGSNEWDFSWKRIPKRKVCQAYLAYTHSSFTQNLEIIENEQHQKGLSDLYGNVVLYPQYNDIISFTDDLFIVAKPCSDGESLAFGVVDSENEIIVPFDFKCLIPINNKYLAFTDDKSYTITEDNKYYKLEMPRLNSHYVGINFGIMDLDCNRLTAAEYYTIISPKDADTFIIAKSGYGLINKEGCYILEPKYSNITYSQEAECFIANLVYYDSGKSETYSNNVTSDGYFIVHDIEDQPVLVPAKIVDWCGNFSEQGIALAIKDGHLGHINRTFQIVAFSDNEWLVIPEEYEFSGDFKYGFASVLKNYKLGIINTKLEQIISCDFEYIEPLSENRFKFKNNGLWGVVDLRGKIIIDSIYISICRETESFIKVATSVQNGSCTILLYGLYDNDGKLIIEAKCSNIAAFKHEAKVFVIATINHKQGVYDNNGYRIIPHIYDRIELKDGHFACHLLDSNGSYYYRKIITTNEYNLSGEYLLTLSERQTIVVPAEYDVAYPCVNGLIIVVKEGLWGMINLLNDVIVTPQYSIIETLGGPYVRAGKSHSDSHIFFQDDCVLRSGLKYGLIDYTGEVVLPLEYDTIKLLDNGDYHVRMGTMQQILTPCLKVAITIENKKYKILDNHYIIIYETKDLYMNKKWKLIDFHGNEVIPEDRYSGFSNIEVLGNGFFKVIFRESEFTKDLDIGIIDNRGKEIYRNSSCIDILLMGNGYILVKDFRYTNFTNRSGYYVYNVVNFQGDNLFEYSLNEIKLLEDGNFSVRGCFGWGFANRMGHLIAATRYQHELKFDNDFADISIEGKDETLKINSIGNIQVVNDKETILLPSIYYWGTHFKCGISIVRSIAKEYIGVVNVHGEEIIPTIYKSVKLLSDKTILCREGDCYGIYNTAGDCILPAIFFVIDYVAPNRLRVVWNIDIAKSWDRNKFEKGISNSKLKGSGVDYEQNQRAALCDSSGTILNDTRFLFISKFTGKYAKAYTEIKVDNYKTQLCQAGIIDVDGNTLVSPEYDRIVLYNHSFALLRKGKIYGIVNLNSIEIVMFDSLPISKIWDLDKNGRCLFSTDWAYDHDNNEWTGTKGVLSCDGVIVPPNKYDKVILLENGLIKVYKNSTIGLLDKNGKIILPLEYFYISDFVGHYASICIDGHIDEDDPYNITGGKWGMIDDSGNILVSPEYDRIVLYNHSFALLRKGKIYGIVNLNSIEIVMFDSLPISKIWDLDKNGRCLFSTDWAYDHDNNEWTGTKGVLSCDGVIVPPNKYDKVILLENGLIKVYKNSTIGLLDKNGKIILPLEYSYISDFVGHYASICIDGQINDGNPFHIDGLDDGDPYNITGGKWGMIDDSGNIVIECVNNEELALPSNDRVPIATENTIENHGPAVLLSDYVPDELLSYSACYYDNFGDCDDDYDYDNGYSKYGGYNGYDDKTIDDALRVILI